MKTTRANTFIPAVRRHDLERNSTVHALVREYVTTLGANEDRARGARRTFWRGG